MTRTSSHLAVLALLFAFVAVAPVHAADKPVATVNNLAIPQARLELSVKAAEKQGQNDSPELRKEIKEELIDLEIIAQEARKKGLDKQPEVAEMVEVTRQRILRTAFAQDFIKKHPITEAALKQEYEKQKKSVLGKKEYKVAHILVDSEKAAQAVAALLKNKGDFAKIAKEKSQDSGSKAQGGELGWANPGAFVPAFSEAMLKLNKGQVSAPVQTQYGWHIIKVEDIRDFEIPPFEKVKANFEQGMQQRALQEAVASLRAGAKIN